jgi:four helix bundle protein
MLDIKYNMSYKKLQIWILAREIVIEVHEMTMKLPRFEMYEEGSQIRRSSKTTKVTIVEGYGRRRYKQDWIKFLVYALSSNDETMDHLETLWDTKSLTDEIVYTILKDKVERLGRMINAFLKTVEAQHQSLK